MTDFYQELIDDNNQPGMNTIIPGFLYATIADEKKD
ncbi:Uncharacterised protein [Corynebacterium kutscheri]|nr:Uncharacterised protein [Corynebacterium kutscheri]